MFPDGLVRALSVDNVRFKPDRFGIGERRTKADLGDRSLGPAGRMAEFGPSQLPECTLIVTLELGPPLNRPHSTGKRKKGMGYFPLILISFWFLSGLLEIVRQQVLIPTVVWTPL